MRGSRAFDERMIQRVMHEQGYRTRKSARDNLYDMLGFNFVVDLLLTKDEQMRCIGGSQRQAIGDNHPGAWFFNQPPFLRGYRMLYREFGRIIRWFDGGKECVEELVRDICESKVSVKEAVQRVRLWRMTTEDDDDE